MSWKDGPGGAPPSLIGPGVCRGRRSGAVSSNLRWSLIQVGAQHSTASSRMSALQAVPVHRIFAGSERKRNTCSPSCPCPTPRLTSAPRRSDRLASAARRSGGMDNLTRLYRIRKTCLEMLNDRGYLIVKVPLRWHARAAPAPGGRKGADGAQAARMHPACPRPGGQGGTWGGQAAQHAAGAAPPLHARAAAAPRAAGRPGDDQGPVSGKVWRRAAQGRADGAGVQAGAAGGGWGVLRSPLNDVCCLGRPPPVVFAARGTHCRPPTHPPTHPLCRRTTPPTRSSSSTPTRSRWG